MKLTTTDYTSRTSCTMIQIRHKHRTLRHMIIQQGCDDSCTCSLNRTSCCRSVTTTTVGTSYSPSKCRTSFHTANTMFLNKNNIDVITAVTIFSILISVIISQITLVSSLPNNNITSDTINSNTNANSNTSSQSYVTQSQAKQQPLKAPLLLRPPVNPFGKDSSQY